VESAGLTYDFSALNFIHFLILILVLPPFQTHHLQTVL
jgi:hypothetical protein